MNKPMAWTIAGSDSSGGAGIQADLKTFMDLGVHAASVITAITAQNSHSISAIECLTPTIIQQQIATLKREITPHAIKIGMLGSTESIEVVSDFLKTYHGFAVCDPVMGSSSGVDFFLDIECFVKNILPYVDLITPNISEAQRLTDSLIETHQDIINAAEQLLSLGVKSVLVKGGHFANDYFAADYWTDGKDSYWLSLPRINAAAHGSGCVLSSAIVACLANQFSILDALVIAKMYVTLGIRCRQRLGNGTDFVTHNGFPDQLEDLPYMSKQPLQQIPVKFPICNQTSLGLYPVVADVITLEKLLKQGADTIQLRIKDPNTPDLDRQIKFAIKLARFYQARLFINDYWQLAIKYGAYGVHLGQGDLISANLEAILTAGLRLGISTHCFYEVACAHRFRPSYIACGPIYPTTSKVMPFEPQGEERLRYWCQLLKDYPIVAIGGINKNRIQAVHQAGSNGYAFISAMSDFF